MNLSSLLLVPPPALADQDRLTVFCTEMLQYEQEIRKAAGTVAVCNVFDQALVGKEHCTLAIKALGSLQITVLALQQSFLCFSVPLRVLEAREGAQGPWRLVLEQIDETVVLLASLRAILSATEAYPLLQLDVFEQQHELLRAVSDAFAEGARWRGSLRFEDLVVARMRAAAELRHKILKRRRRWN